MGEDLISIIVPIYNVSKYLKQCIDSIINQTYNNLEILLMDDGSTDNSLEIVKEYSEHDNRIKYYTRDNRGLLYTRIDGVRKSTGKYIMFVDSDDWLEINAIEVLYKKIIDYSADMVKSSYRQVSEKKQIKILRADKDIIFENDNYNKMYDEIVSNYTFHSVWSQLIKADIVKGHIEKSDYSISMGEDLEINMQLLDKYNRIVVTDDILYNYRVNTNSMSNIVSYDKVKNKVNDLIKVYTHFSEFIRKNSPNNYKNALKKMLADLNRHILDFSITEKNKKTELEDYMKSLFSSDLINEIKNNLPYEEIEVNKLKKILFYKNIYNSDYKKFIHNLRLYSGYRRLKH